MDGASLSAESTSNRLWCHVTAQHPFRWILPLTIDMCATFPSTARWGAGGPRGSFSPWGPAGAPKPNPRRSPSPISSFCLQHSVTAKRSTGIRAHRVELRWVTPGQAVHSTPPVHRRSPGLEGQRSATYHRRELAPLCPIRTGNHLPIILQPAVLHSKPHIKSYNVSYNCLQVQ